MLDRRPVRDNPEAVKAVVEYYQTADQEVRAPQAPQPYLGGRTEL